MKYIILTILYIFIITGCGGGGGGSTNENTGDFSTIEISGGVTNIEGEPNFSVSLNDKMVGKLKYKKGEYSNLGEYPQSDPNIFELSINGIRFFSKNNDKENYFIYVENSENNRPTDYISIQGTDPVQAKNFQVDSILLELELYDSTKTVLSDHSIPNSIIKEDYDSGQLQIISYKIIQINPALAVGQPVWSIHCDFSSIKIIQN